MAKFFNAFEGHFLCGHTHLAGVFTQTQFSAAHEFDGRFSIADESVVINVGSVGLPRDEPRACYMIDHGDSYEFVRVPYDYQTARQKLINLNPPK